MTKRDRGVRFVSSIMTLRARFSCKARRSLPTQRSDLLPFFVLMKLRPKTPAIAYFSMEVALDPNMPTYSGGLGMLAGDTLRSAADLGASLAAVTLVYRKGYFRQYLDAQGNQSEQPQQWEPERSLKEVEGRVTVEIEGRPVVVRAFQFDVKGIDGDIV